MVTFTSRYLSLLVVSCLLADPCAAGAIAHASNFSHRLPASSSSSAFESQALAYPAQFVRRLIAGSFQDRQEINQRCEEVTRPSHSASVLGGAATFADFLSDDERRLIANIILEKGTDKHPIAVDVSAFELRDPALAELVRNTHVYVLERLSEFDHQLLAHAGVGGEVFDQQDPRDHAHKAVYFSPNRYQTLLQLSPDAQMAFWQHEILGHLENPHASEAFVREKYPLDRVQLEAALLFFYGGVWRF